MSKEVTFTLATSPEDSLRALKGAVAQCAEWSILTKDAQTWFVIEKSVRYYPIRGVALTATYHVSGTFQQTPHGETTLHYSVAGDSWAPTIQAILHIGVLLVFALLIGSLAFNPSTVNGWVGALMSLVLLGSAIAYGIFAYRSYHSQLRELNRFMENFAQRMANDP